MEILKIRLPAKLSGLIKTAVRDVKQVKAKGHKLNMQTWLDRNGHCEVCMGGAVMLRALKWSKPNHDLSPDCYDVKTGNKLEAIDRVRVGMIEDALGFLDVPDRTIEKHKAVLRACEGQIAKHVNRTNFRTEHAPWRTYLSVAKKLEAAGL